MAAEVDFQRGSEPAELVPGLRGEEEGGLGLVHLAGQRLHPLVGLRRSEVAHPGGVPREGSVGEGVDQPEVEGHGPVTGER